MNFNKSFISPHFLFQNGSLPTESQQHMSQASNLSSIGDWSQASADVSIRERQRRQPDEHYWDISSISSIESSRSSLRSDRYSLRSAQLEHKKEHYWEGTNVELAPVPAALVLEGSAEQLAAYEQQQQNRTRQQQQKEQYWEGYNEEPAVPEQQRAAPGESSRKKQQQHEKPYWA
jgi:hypothetical protein